MHAPWQSHFAGFVMGCRNCYTRKVKSVIPWLVITALLIYLREQRISLNYYIRVVAPCLKIVRFITLHVRLCVRVCVPVVMSTNSSYYDLCYSLAQVRCVNGTKSLQLLYMSFYFMCLSRSSTKTALAAFPAQVCRCREGNNPIWINC